MKAPTKPLWRPNLGMRPLPMNETVLRTTYQALREPAPLTPAERAQLKREQRQLQREAAPINSRLDHLSALLGPSSPNALP
jgi:hypothetical protein